jgi:hypothetical protein
MLGINFKQGSTQRGIAKILVAVIGYGVLRLYGLEAANQFVLYGMGFIGAMGIADKQ